MTNPNFLQQAVREWERDLAERLLNKYSRNPESTETLRQFMDREIVAWLTLKLKQAIDEGRKAERRRVIKRALKNGTKISDARLELGDLEQLFGVKEVETAILKESQK